MDWKQIAVRDLKAEGDAGDVQAVFATLGVIDSDGDRILAGAIGKQAVRLSAYGHGSWHGALPVGRGRVYEDGNDAIFAGRFFTETEAGRETYLTVKAMGDLQEWSFALPEIDFEVVNEDGRDVREIKRVVIPEVSPVLMGAGVNTRTLAIKSKEKRAIGSHSTDTSDDAWSAGDNVRRLRNDAGASYYRRAFAWVDPDGDPAVKSSYKFPHHFVDAEGNIGAASTRAASAGIAVLNGGRGGADIPDGDRRAVYNHLARHLRDADRDAPELRDYSAPSELPLIEHALVVADELRDLSGRVVLRATKRREEGRRMNADVLEVLNGIVADAGTLAAAVAPGTAPVEAQREALRTLRQQYLRGIAS